MLTVDLPLEALVSCHVGADQVADIRHSDLTFRSKAFIHVSGFI